MITTLTTAADWKDAGRLRERLAEVRANAFLPLRMLGVEAEIVRTLATLTGRTAEELRAVADEDALALEDF